MDYLLVIEQLEKWPQNLLPNANIITAKSYLTQNIDNFISNQKNIRIINLCAPYKYQSLGYYVSLLAEARDHKVLPSVSTLQDLNMQSMIRYISQESDIIIQKSLETTPGDLFDINIYFGKNEDKGLEKLCSKLFELFPAPLMKASFKKTQDTWKLRELRPVSINDIAISHYEFIKDTVEKYTGFRKNSPSPNKWRYDLAILYNPKEKNPPSNETAIKKFVKAGSEAGFRVELIDKQDIGYIAEFDALFIRETTNVNHHTYQFARRAKAEGLVVIDDPESILKCSNKVYLAELFKKNKIPSPQTLIIHRGNKSDIEAQITFPTILKVPDGNFSIGVKKVKDRDEFKQQLGLMLNDSDLVIAQEYVPSQFDWRIGILNKKALYACKYFMAPGHWQIYNNNESGKKYSGNSETIPIGWAPKHVVKTALNAANLIGDGFYGVDLKEIDGKCFVIEINDNPNIDANIEDMVLKDELYTNIMETFVNWVEERKRK